MNQEVPSRVALPGSAAFAWNDRDYDPAATSLFAARALAGNDADTTRALLMLFDLEHLAPTFGSQPWQPQAPALSQELDRVRDALATGNAQAREQALGRLDGLAEAIATAPARIRSGVKVAGFAEQAAPWLQAMALWGDALRATRAGLGAALSRDADAAGHFAQARRQADAAAQVQTIANTTRPQGAIRVGDGVLDRFIADAPGLVHSAAGSGSARAGAN